MAQTGIATTQVAYDCSSRIIQEEMQINIAKRFAPSGGDSGKLVKIMSQADNNLLVSLANIQGK